MRVAIRALGIASAVFWVFLIIFGVFAVLSMPNFQMSFGEMQTGIISGNEVELLLPISVANKGFLSVGDFNVSTRIVDEQGLTLAAGQTFIPEIGAGETVNATHQVSLGLNEFLADHAGMILNDSELRVEEMVGMKVAQIVPVRASSNVSIPWGAPLYNFAVGAPELSLSGLNYSRIVVPISFENHAFFSLNGTLHVRVYNSSNLLVGVGQSPVDVQQNSVYKEKLGIDVSTGNATLTGHIEVFLETSVFSYGPVVIPFGV